LRRAVVRTYDCDHVRDQTNNKRIRWRICLNSSIC
jgi:hypothetical protein